MANQADQLLQDIADYVLEDHAFSQETMASAQLVLMDTIGCGFLALNYPECTKHLGPIVPGTIVPNGARVPGTPYELDPVQAAFNIGCMVRWLDYNNTWLAAEWGHPSDNLGAILATADYVSRLRLSKGDAPLVMEDVLIALIKAHEIQGILSLENSLNRVGLDHILFVKIASTAVACAMLGGTKDEVINALSNAWLDNSSLRTYRHKPSTGSRKSWAAGDATSRAVRLALMAVNGEMGYPQALSAPKWGAEDVIFHGQRITLAQPLSSYVIDNVLFKAAFPAEFHAQTAAEAAMILHANLKGRFAHAIDKIVISTHESALRIIDKKGELLNPADRDHCLQYVTAIGLIYGEITADHYGDEVASNSLIDQLRSKMEVVEDKRYSHDYLDPTKRSIANAVQIHFRDGSTTQKVEVEYPIGHPRRRNEAIPYLYKKFEYNLRGRFTEKRVRKLVELFQNNDQLKTIPVNRFVDDMV